MERDLILVTLNEEQISKAKEVNGKRKQISHALVCGKHGVIFGTEKQCRKYYSAWRTGGFSKLFGKCYETDNYRLGTYQCSGNPVMKLIEESERRNPKKDFIAEAARERRRGFWSKLFGG